MPREIDSTTKNEIRDMIYDFFSEECDVPKNELGKDTNIIEELGGDSLMLLSLLEMVRTKYDLTITLKTLGGHLMKKPANTIGQIEDLTLAIVKHGDDVVNVEF
jgi:acyl carrier protein